MGNTNEISTLVEKYQNSTTEFRHIAFQKLSAILKADINKVIDSDKIHKTFGLSMQTDYFIPTDFIKNIPAGKIKDAVEATLFYVVLNLSLIKFNEIFGNDKTVVKSLINKDKNGNYVDLTSIYRNIITGVKKYVVQIILSKTPTISQYQYKYQTCLYRNDYYFFDFITKSPEYDILVPAEMFFDYYVNYGNRFAGLFYREICLAPFYQKAIREFDKALIPIRNILLKDKYSDIYCILAEKWSLISAAQEITHFIDGSKIQESEHTWENANGGRPANRTKVPHGRKNRKADKQFNLFQGEGIRTEKEVCGTKVKFELLPALNHSNDYSHIAAGVKDAVSAISSSLSRIFTEHTNKIQKTFEETGEVDIENWYRRRLDNYIYRDVITKTDLANLFNIYFLIDNSCSIGEKKQSVLKQIIVAFAEVIRSYPDKFNNMYAYTQNSSGNKMVSMRRLICKKVDQLNNNDLHKLLHLKPSGVNYDILALLNLLDQHLDQKDQDKSINLVIILGDAWPVTYGLTGVSSVFEEQEKVLRLIRKKHNAIITYYAVNKLYDPRKLHYDHFISLKSDEFSPLQKFSKEFPVMIQKILKARKI